jgi:hypothetical protein
MDLLITYLNAEFKRDVPCKIMIGAVDRRMYIATVVEEKPNFLRLRGSVLRTWDFGVLPQGTSTFIFDTNFGQSFSSPVRVLVGDIGYYAIFTRSWSHLGTATLVVLPEHAPIKSVTFTSIDHPDEELNVSDLEVTSLPKKAWYLF